ncbi:hypothetical protein F8606_19935 [Salmonella enterica]|nr:hypothetical protein [Salmonella enterica]EEG5324565.1 hypothetical protein [Salmonella enterica]EGG5311086.1 hypothetical protein [Salmonella enterica]
MKNITQLVFRPKKSAIAKGVARPGTIWFDNDDQDEIDALSTLAIKEAGFKRSDFFKPVRVDHLVVDDMPAEGVFDTAFCDRYKLAEDGKSWLLPAAQPKSGDSDTTDTSNQEQGNEDATSITDSGDTASAASSDTGTTTAADSDSAADTAGSADTETDASTESPGAETVDGEELPAYAYNVNGEPLADVEKSMLHPVATLSERHRILSQFILEDKFSHQITPEQLAEVIRLELDVSDNYIQDMLLATRNAPVIHKFNTPDLWKYTYSFKKVFARDKRHPLSRMINFDQAYAAAHPIDRGLLVQEWIKGNYISRVEKSGATSASASVSAAPEPQKTSATKADVAASDKPATKTTYKAIDIRIGRALAKEAVTYPITARDVEQGKAIVEADGEEFKRWSATYRITENIQFYDEKTHIEMIRQAPREVVTGSPELRRAYVDNYLAAYGTLDPDQMVFMSKRAPVDHKENMERVRKAGKNLRDMAAGRFKCDEEKPQSEDVLADEPAAPETVEPDANEHHPDTRSMATESSVTADSDKTSREQFSEQLAADRGDFVPGISDPSDPKWVHNDYSASNEGEKTEVGADDVADAADSADHSEEFSSQPKSETSHSEAVADQNEPETPETEPESQKPEPVTKAEITPLNNDDRTTEQAADSNQDSEPDRSLAPEPEPGTMLEILLLLRKVARDLRHIVDINQQILDSNQLTLASNLNIEKSHRKDAAAIRGMLAMMYATETEEAENGE